MNHDKQLSKFLLEWDKRQDRVTEAENDLRREMTKCTMHVHRLIAYLEKRANQHAED